MHGRGLDYVLLVNAEVDSMGGVIDGGIGIDTKASPRRAAIEKAQAELRQEYDVREERRRELEFLEKGGNPLDFKFGSGASISFQSTSLTDQFVTSEAKGSFALTASPHGDSVESSGRLGVPLGRETNTADNLLLFDAETDVLEGEKSFTCPNGSNIVPSEQSSQLDDIHNNKEPEDLAISPFVVKSQAYARRNRSRKSRDSARACSTELGPTPGGNGSSGLPSSRHGSRNMKGFCETGIIKNYSVSSVSKSKFTSTNGDVVTTATSENHIDMELDVPQVHGTDNALPKSVIVEVESDATASRDLQSIDHDQQPPVNTNQSPSSLPDLIGGRGVLSGVEPCATKMEGPGSVGQAQGFSIPNIDDNDVLNVGLISSKKGLDLESSCSPTNLRLDGDTEDQCLKKINSYENSKKSTVTKETPETPDTAVLNVAEENKESKGVEALVITTEDPTSLHQKHIISDSCVKSEEEILENNFSLKSEMEVLANNEGMECSDHNSSKVDRKLDNPLVDESNTERTDLCPQGRPTNTTDSSQCEFLEAASSGKGSETAPALDTCTGSQIKLASKVLEDSVLEEARIIEAKRKRIAELSVVSFPLENRRKSHWDFVLEEMAWLANDFMQESLWKRTAAAQISQLVASSGRSRFDKQNLLRMQRKVTQTLSKAITEFWHSAEVLLSSNDPSIDIKDAKLASVGSQKLDGGASIETRISEPNMETIKTLEKQSSWKVHRFAVRKYAIRFLKYCNSSGHLDQAEAPRTPDRISDLGMMEWEDQSSEETLFYRVPLDAMEGYRKSVELHWSQYENSVRNMQHEEVETLIYDTDADFGFQENAYEEYDGETGIHYLPGAFEGSKSSKLAQKKRKNPSKSYNARSYEVGADLPYGHSMDSKMGTHSSFLIGKRPSNSINVGSIPTKRVRTAARQRLVSPFSAGATGGVQLPNKTDASSGDTSSFQDDQSTVLGGGSQIRKGLELESTGEFGKQLQSDSADISMKPKKKKPKHMVYKNSFNSTNSGGYGIGKGSAYEQRWQLDSMVQNEQRDHSKKRLDIHGFESNGNGGQYVAKKPKIMKQLSDTSLENISPLIGSIPSPVASQVSNLSNPSKLIKMFAGRDRGRKGKALKVPAGQSGLNSPSWSQFEDQALVVLVHDMGPNFELVSDVFNNTLQFKCIFRKPNDCKERHRLLMDKDGADSADDSGSSQPYPATLPGIPQGSARQLFQRLQGPMEEDTLKSHFEKIIFIGQQQHSRKSQNDIQDLKQIAPVHNSHIHALSTVCPNNLNGVPLTPLDICDATSSSTDVIPLGYQGSHTSGLAISNQGSVAPVLPTSGSNSMLQGSSGMPLGNSLSSPSAPLNVSRDGHRFGGPRPPSLPIDEQQRMQQYNQILSGRNIQHSGLSVPGSLPGTDRGVRLLPGANGMGMMCGMSRGMPMPRPGFQGIGSQSMLNMASPGNMLSSAGVGMPNSVNQGTSMMRSRGDALHMMRPVQNLEDQRQMMQELQLQATQGNTQGISPPFSGMCTNQTPPPPGQTFPIQHQQQQHQIPLQQSHLLNTAPQHPPNLQGNNHAAATPQQQAYMIRLAKDRQHQHHQQRFYHQQQQQQQQHQFAASNISPMPHGQPQSQHLPMSSSCLPNNSQIHQQQVSSLPPSNSQLPLTSSSPMNTVSSQPQQKQHHLPHGLGRNNHQGGSGGGLPTQMMKQRQRQQQLQQTGRQLPQQRQSSQQQPAKHIKGMGRGNTAPTHQNLPSVDPGHVNGVSTTNPGSQVHEKGDQQAIHLMQQGQGLLSGSNSVQAGKSFAVPPTQPSSSQPHQKLFSRSPPSVSKQVPQKMSSHPDHCIQGQPSASVSSGHTPLASQQLVPPSTMPMTPSQQQPQAQTQLPPRQAGHSQQQSAQRMLNQNYRQMNNSDPHMQSSVDQPQHVNTSTFHMPQQGCSAESTSVIPVVSSSSTGNAQWNASEEPLYDSNVPNSVNHLSASLGSNSPLPSTAETEPAASPSQDVTSHVQYPGSAIPVHGNNVGAPWQPQPSQQQPPPSSPQKQSLPPEQQQQPPQQHSQAGQTGLYARPSNSGPGPGPGPG